MAEEKLLRRVPSKFNAFKKTRTAKVLKIVFNVATLFPVLVVLSIYR